MADEEKARLERALLSLAGLSVGDALGQRFFVHLPLGLYGRLNVTAVCTLEEPHSLDLPDGETCQWHECR